MVTAMGSSKWRSRTRLTLASAEALEVATRQGYSLGTALRLENQTLNSLELRISGWVGIKWLGEGERTAD